MNARSRAARLVAIAVLTHLAACAGSPPPNAPACTTALDCAAPAHCVDGACVADAPPVADFVVPSSPGTNTPIQLVSTSSDPDDRVVSHRWKITPGAGACPADPGSGDAAALEVLFFCAGAYEIELVAVDEAGVASAPKRVTIQAVQTPGAPTVTAGPALDVAHRCGGTPLRCASVNGAAETFQLTATASDPDGDPIAYEWKAFPPLIPAGALAPVATFVTSAASYAPTVMVESAGGPIAGEWRFRVRATDRTGLVAQAEQVVRVSNQPPSVVPGARPTLPHRFEAGAYLASGDVPFTVADPDGDPTEASADVIEPGSTCTSSGAPSQGGAAISISCTAPGELIGPARAVRIVAADVNGGQGTADLPVDVGNRPPVVRVSGADPAPALLWFDHGVRTYEGGDRFFVTDANPFAATDPDGDPVGPVALEAIVDASRPFSTQRTWTDAGGQIRFEFTTPLDSPFEFRSPDGRTGFSLAGRTSDPWAESTPLVVPVAIRNRPPGVEPLAAAIAVPHHYDKAAGAYRAAATFGPFADPDGDPVALGPGSGGTGPCTASGAPPLLRVDCTLPYTPASGAPTLAQFAGVRNAAAAIADPWATVQTSATVDIGNRAPSIWPQSVIWTSFYCEIGWEPDSGYMSVTFADPDGDPALAHANGFVDAVLLPPGGTILGCPYPGSAALAVSVSDGVASASTTYTIAYDYPTTVCRPIFERPPPPEY